MTGALAAAAAAAYIAAVIGVCREAARQPSTDERGRLTRPAAAAPRTGEENRSVPR